MKRELGQKKSLVVTGAAGFIGSCIVRYLNNEGVDNLVLVDDFSHALKVKNLDGKVYAEKISIADFLDWFRSNADRVGGVFHFGACSDTTIFDQEIFDCLNREYSKAVWYICTNHNIPLVYASSAATYGAGKAGYSDDHEHTSRYKPLNPYGQSKHDIDLWALEQTKTPPRWYGLKLFNVYGPNEYHKGRMASMVFHGFNQIQSRGFVELFRSHRPGISDGGQRRDFIYVKDAVDVCLFFLTNPAAPSGLYNVGTGRARSFLDMQHVVFTALGKTAEIHFVDIPEGIREKYQYFTEASLSKLRAVGYEKSCRTLEEGVSEYIREYLLSHKHW